MVYSGLVSVDKVQKLKSMTIGMEEKTKEKAFVDVPQQKVHGNPHDVIIIKDVTNTEEPTLETKLTDEDLMKLSQ